MREVSQATFPKWKLRLTLLLCLLECLFYGATVTGWASIVYVFKQDGVFSHLCEDIGGKFINGTEPQTTAEPLGENGGASNGSLLYEMPSAFPTCSTQDRMFSLIFTMALMVWGAVGIPFGFFFDKYGILKTRLISVVCGITGYLMIAWAGSDRYTSYLLFPGVVFQVVCCFTTLTSCTHMAALAGRYASTFQALCIGAASSSIVIFLIVKILHEVDVSRKITLTVVAGIWIIVLLYSYFIMPHYKVAVSSTTTSEEGKAYDLVKTENALNDSKALPESSKLPTDEKQDKIESDDKTPTLWQCMKTLPYLFLNIWFALIYLAYNAFLGTYNPWITKIANGDNDKVNHLTNVLAYCQLSSLIISLFPGMLTDYFRRKMTDRGDMTQGAATVPALLIDCTMAVIMHACILVNKLNAVYVVAIVSEFTRTFMFSTCVSFIAITYRGNHYGTLFGISYCLAGVANLFQFPLFIWADTSNSYIGMSAVLLVCAVLGYCLPIYMIIYRMKGAQKKGK